MEKHEIRLRKMSEEDFSRFREYSIFDYAETMLKAGNLDKKQALIEAEGEFNKLLDNGLHTTNQFLMVIEDIKKGSDIGWIWYMYEEDDSCKKAFVCDFLIFEEERRKGYATEALRELERMVKEDERSLIALYVWKHNVPASNLYKKCGYEITDNQDDGAYMIKQL